MNKVWTRNHHLRRFALAGMHVQFVGAGWTSMSRRALVEDVDHIVMRFIELCLREIRQEAVVASVAIHNQDLFAAIAGHLIRRFLEKGKLKTTAVGHGSWLVLGFRNLAEIILGKNHSIFLLRCV